MTLPPIPLRKYQRSPWYYLRLLIIIVLLLVGVSLGTLFLLLVVIYTGGIGAM